MNVALRVHAASLFAKNSALRHCEIERDEPPIEGEAIAPGSMVYKVLRVLPSEGEFDGIIEVEWQAGPTQVITP